MTSPLNPSGKKHRFGKAWMHEHVTDPYVREASRRGFRSRTAFKLLELVQRDWLLRPGISVVDLGAAPGSWSQVLRERLGRGATIVAIDLLPMQPIPGVQCIRGDFEHDEVQAALEAALPGRRVDLVLSDMSPNLSGIDAVDQARSMGLAERALYFACTHLQPGGDLVSRYSRARGSIRSCATFGVVFRRFTCASPKRRATAVANITWWPKRCWTAARLSLPGDKTGKTARVAKSTRRTRRAQGATAFEAGRMNRFRRSRRQARVPRPVGGRPERSTAARSVA
jgi:23S rRNA (uridine2552-2'-O)-methyltransferase